MRHQDPDPDPDQDQPAEHFDGLFESLAKPIFY
jgi:hypothetical protein